MSFQIFTCYLLISLSKALMYVVINYQKGEIESTSAPWVILVIHDNIPLIGLIPLPSVFQISSTLEWHGHGQEDVEPLQDAKDKYRQKFKTLHFLF